MRGRYLTPDTPSSGYICRLLKIPNSIDFEAIVSGALDDLQNAWNFEQHGSLTPDETASLFVKMFEDYRESRGCLVGTIFAHACAIAPIGSLPCDGASFLRGDYPDLYDALDVAYHIDSTHGRVPDLRGRSVIGVGQGSGLSNRAIDSSGGEETHTLTQSELALHGHGIAAVPIAFTPGAAPAVGFGGAVPTAGTFSNSPGGGAHENMHPWRALRYAIWAR